MKKNISYTTCLLILLLSSSCKEEIPFDVPVNERKLVLNSLITNDSLITARVYRSNLVTDNFTGDLYENNAVVALFQNNEFIENLTFLADGTYQSQVTKAKAGETYALQVNSPTGQNARGSVSVLYPVPILAFDSIGIVRDGIYDERVLLRLKFKDNGNTKNYYRVSVAAYETHSYSDPENPEMRQQIYFLRQWIESNDPGLDADYDNYLYFSDVLFNGKEYSFDILMDKYDFGYNKEYFYVFLENISFDFYRYAVALPAHFDAEEMKFFMEAVLVYNNIENGLGIIGSSAASIDSLYNNNYRPELK
jgi:hypothetical protein